VDYYLVSEEVEVDPLIATAALFAFQDIPVKAPAFLKIMYWDGYVERGYCFHT
jgi:hypothetical protein